MTPASPVSEVASELVLYAACLPATPFRDYVAAAAGAGFDAVTMWPLVYRRAQSREGLTPADMRAVAADAGVRIVDLDPCGVWLPEPPAGEDTPVSFRSVWERHQFFDCAEALGIDTLVAVHLGEDDVDPAVAVAGFAALCDDAAEHGLRVGLEFMPFSGVRDLLTAVRIVAEAGRPNGGLTLDLWHVARSGSALTGLVPEQVFCVQLSDGPALAPADLREEAMWHRRLPGEGAMPLAAGLAQLARLGVRTRVGPELYRRGFSEREPARVAADLMTATCRVLAGA